MNAVEIEEAVSRLAEQPFDPEEFPFAFLEAFGNKTTTIKRLRSGASNKSDLGGVLQTNNIHIATADRGAVTECLTALRASPATAKAKAKFILATDGNTLEAEDIESGETVACAFTDFPDHFGFFLPLAGISTVRQVRESSFDIRATSRLNRLYVELLKDNPDWGAAERRPDMNHFMARLIFCFFAEDTDIFHRSYPFTGTVEKMSDRDSSNTHEVIGELFRAMNTPIAEREAAGIARWANPFPYVNGGLFSGSLAVPRFSKIARSYLLHIGSLDWTKINPDIFGSMIQAVADDEERSALGMHYTSVPNILKVLNPLFLDDLRAHLAEAGDNPRKLLNLRNRMAKIRVFDPACGSGNFLVIAYKEMRAIEAEINRRRGEEDRASDIPLTNFRGIELRDFPAEIARLALIIALGMAKEGFDWIWCEHALTVGYRASLTEIVQIIGRATRDAPGKTRARFTNLIAEPDAAESAVTEAVNDTLKAIAASLLMEQVLAPRFEFKPKNPATSTATPGFDYGEGGYDPDKCNVGFHEERGVFQIEIKGLAEPKSPEAARICREDLNEVIATFVQDKPSIERGLFDEELVPEELTQVRLGKIIKDKYPELDEEDQEAVRQHAIAAINLTQQAKKIALGGDGVEPSANTALIDGVRKFAMDVRELDIDLIDRINPFGEAYAILAKTMSEDSLKTVAAAIAAKRTSLTPEEARELARRALKFKQERGRLPSITSADAWEKRMAEGVAFLARMKAEAARG